MRTMWTIFLASAWECLFYSTLLNCSSEGVKSILSYCLSVSLVLFNVHIVFAEQNHYEGQKIGFQFFSHSFAKINECNQCKISNFCRMLAVYMHLYAKLEQSKKFTRI